MFVRVYVRIRALFSVSSKMELLSLIKKSRLVHLCFAITFFTSGVLINCIQFCCYYSLKYVDKRLYRKINFYLCYSLYSCKFFLQFHTHRSIFKTNKVNLILSVTHDIYIGSQLKLVMTIRFQIQTFQFVYFMSPNFTN